MHVEEPCQLVGRADETSPRGKDVESIEIHAATGAGDDDLLHIGRGPVGTEDREQGTFRLRQQEQEEGREKLRLVSNLWDEVSDFVEERSAE